MLGVTFFSSLVKTTFQTEAHILSTYTLQDYHIWHTYDRIHTNNTKLLALPKFERNRLCQPTRTEISLDSHLKTKLTEEFP